ncbi:MAG: ABC transporter permease/substrate-binding protein [Planctomycetota bacterium]|jgi:osmoprotectant transport system permease protein
MIRFFREYGGDIWTGTYEHVFLVVTALKIALAIALPLGVFLAKTKWERFSATVLAAVGSVQTVPSLALVALVAVLFSKLRLPTIGVSLGMVALVVYSLLPIVRNTYTGIRQVDPSVVEVARGMGMTPRQILLKVELPLSLPVVMAGIRIAVVWTIGVGMLCGLIGAGGLGSLIWIGLSMISPDHLLAGSAPAVALALLANWGLGRVERWLTPAGLEEAKPRREASFQKRLAAAVVVLVVAGALLVAFRPGRGSGRGIKAGFTAEFLGRPDGYAGLAKHYGFEFPGKPRQVEAGLMYKAVSEGSIDVICAFATDGRIAAYDLLVLEDDLSFFPPYYAAPVVRRATLAKHPELEGVLGSPAGKLPDVVMRSLNYEVDGKQRKPSEVAREFLVREGLIPASPASATPGDGSAGTVAIGGKNFTEQRVLGEIMAILIETRTRLAVDRRLNLGGTMICFNALRAGDLDLYAEYTGTGLVSILKREAISDPEDTYAVVKKEFGGKWGLVWLEPFGFNNTYTLTMRKDHAARLGINTFSDLARHVRASGR